MLKVWKCETIICTIKYISKFLLVLTIQFPRAWMTFGATTYGQIFRGPITFFIREMYREKLLLYGGLYNKMQHQAQT